MNPLKIIVIVMLVSVMLNAGLEINRDNLVAALKNYGLLGRALLANFIIVPLLGVLLARLFKLDQEIALGFLLMAIAPGVPMLVQAAGRTFGGSLGFAAALAFIMPALCVVTIPLTSRLIFPPSVAAHLPFAQTIATLVIFQLVPLLVGLLIADRAPALAGKLSRPLLLVFLVTVVALIVLLAPTLGKAIVSVYGTRAMLAMTVLVVLSIATGWILGGSDNRYRRTLSIATALRNIGTCATIATVSFPGTLAAATVVTYFVIQVLITVILRIYLYRTAAAVA